MAARGDSGGRLPTMPALDGIRALAIAGVVLYHGDLAWFPGGLLGVEVFFVLSGYLITSLLWSELRSSGGIAVKTFLIRRARRLIPALLAMLVIVSTAFLAWWPSEVGRVRGDVAAAATYSSNWYLINADESYFEAFARPSPFGHLWSLAIEEQFYLLWPPVLLLLGLRRRRPGYVAAAILAAAAGSVGWLWHSYNGGDPSRIYYGTDTRAAALLIGSALAVMWRPWDWAEDRPLVPRWCLDAAAVGAGGLLVWSFMRFDDLSAFMYRPGLLLVALATAALIAVCVHPDARVARLLGTRSLRWLGTRSYSVYLWYWPVFVVTRPGVDLDIPVGAAFALRMAFTLCLAEVSYRFIEQPIREGALGRWARRVWDRAGDPNPDARVGTIRFGIRTFAVLLLIVALTGSIVRAPAPDVETAASSPVGLLIGFEEISPVDLTRSGLPAVAVGDSVMVGAKPTLRARFGRIAIDAAVARQVKVGIARLEALRDAGRLGGVVIIHLGNNGRFNNAQFDRIMRILDGVQRVVFVNVKVPRRWERSVNTVIKAGVRKYPTAVMVNWHSSWRQCRGRVFGRDGTHLTDAGARCYAKQISAAAIRAV